MSEQIEMPLEKPAAKTELRSATPTSWDFLTGKADFITDVGLPISPQFQENHAAVTACAQIIGETVASLVLHVYREQTDGVRHAEPSHPVARLFTRAPNPRQTPFEFVEQMTSTCALRGNSFCEVIYDGRGAPVELWPLHPDHVSVLRISGSRRIAYSYSDPDTGGTRRLLPEEILHLRDRSDDSVIGKSRLQRAREALGTAFAAEKFAAHAFRNGAALSGVLSHPGQLDDEPARRIQTQFEKTTTGIANAGRIVVLEEGMKWTPVSVSPQDAEILNSRRFGRETIAMLYRIPLPLLAVPEAGSYGSVIEMNRMFVAHCVMPWARRWESAINAALFSEEARRSTFCEFDLDELSRANLLERWQSYRIAREVGALNANEIRKFERMNPRDDEDGSTFLSPLNMQSEQKGKPREN